MERENTYSFSRAYQIKLLSLCVRRRDFLPGHRDVVAVDWFDDPIHQDISRVILAYYDHYGKPPTYDALNEGLAQHVLADPARMAPRAELYDRALAEIADMILDDEDDVVRRAAHFAKSQALQRALKKGADLLDSGQLEEIPRVVEAAFQIGENRADLGTFHYHDTDRWLQSRNLNVIPTGIAGLDSVIKGIGITELGVIEAPPNKGKTHALVNIGKGALMQGFNVVHVTLENQQVSVGRRYDGCILGAEYAKLLYPEDGTVPTEGTVKQMMAELQEFHRRTTANLVYKYFAPGTASEVTIKSYINTLLSSGSINPDNGMLVIVDYGAKMAPLRQRESKRLEVAECYQGLLRLADYFKCGVWSAAQTNRGGLRKRIIGMEDLAECFEIAADAHMIISVNPTEEEVNGYPLVDLFVARSRETRGQSIIRVGVDLEATRYVGQGDAMSYSDYLRMHDGNSVVRRRSSSDDAQADDLVESMRTRRRRNPSWRGNTNGEGDGI